MKLYLVQHGEAVSESKDPARPLSERGRADVAAVAAFLRDRGIRVHEVWHSTKLRARQTAEILAEALAPGKNPLEHQGVAPNDAPEALLDEICAAKGDLLIASHLPILARLASLLITGRDAYVPIFFHQGGVVCLDREGMGPYGVEWAVTPALVGHERK
jgi:phosphohistidine phosphatase